MTKHGPYTYRINEADLAAAGRHYFRRRLFQSPMRWLLIVIFVLATLLVTTDVWIDGKLEISTMLVVGLGVPMAWVIPQLLAPVIMRRQFRQSASLRDENQLEFGGEAIWFTNKRGYARIPFHELYAWSETDQMILLHQTEAYFNPIPKMALGEEYEFLISALAAADLKRF